MIPKNIFITNYNFKDQKLINIINLIKIKNPEFKIYLFDNKKCRLFLKNHFQKSILFTFDKLKPGAYKSDLFRLCILFKYGGFYIDTYLLPNIKLIEFIDNDQVIVNERLGIHGIFNAFIGSIPNHIFFNKAINGIINNVKNNFYGKNQYDITGPQFLYKYIKYLSKKKIILELNNSGNYITYNNKIIILRLKKYLKIKHGSYEIMWKNRNIYNFTKHL